MWCFAIHTLKRYSRFSVFCSFFSRINKSVGFKCQGKEWLVLYAQHLGVNENPSFLWIIQYNAIYLICKLRVDKISNYDLITIKKVML